MILAMLVGCLKGPLNQNWMKNSQDEVIQREDGSIQLGTVIFEGVKIEPNVQEGSLQDTEQEVKKNIHNGIEQYWEPIGEVHVLLETFDQFIEYEYTENDERNADYLLKEKMAVFHQLTGSAYDIVVAERNYYEVSAAIYVAGATELRFAEMWNRYPTPDTLSENGAIMFGEKVRDTVSHLGDEGRDKLERLIEHYYRARIVGEFTEAALQELQWRFPQDYPIPVTPSPESSLAAFAAYHEVMSDDLFGKEQEWSGIYEEQVALTQRLTDTSTLLTEVQNDCQQLTDVYALLGHAPFELCRLSQLGQLDVLYTTYPGRDLTPELKKGQEVIFKELQASVQRIQDWQSNEYGVFWQKEAAILLRKVQYDKIQALRSMRRTGKVPQLNMNLWEYKEMGQDEVAQSTWNILDAHVAQIEREIAYVIYDLQQLDEMVLTARLRFVFVDAPQTLRDLEFFAQACLFAFPENTEYRTRLLLALADGYGHYLAALTSQANENTVQSISMYQGLLKPFVSALLKILDGQELSEDQEAQMKALHNLGF